MDVEQVERVEAELVAFIERRSKEREKANELEEMWARSERKHRERFQKEHQALWYEFHIHLADNHASLSEAHRTRSTNAGIVGDVLRLFDVLAQADPAGMLAEVRAAAAGV